MFRSCNRDLFQQILTMNFNIQVYVKKVIQKYEFWDGPDELPCMANQKSIYQLMLGTCEVKLAQVNLNPRMEVKVLDPDRY